ncbi:MAG: chloride channel protein [Lentisphaerae bacterium]|nr:chloride channel protein [Lentisphaerota bacterium]
MSRRVLLFLCALTGVVAGLAAVLLKSIAHACREFAASLVAWHPGMVWVAPALPVAGIFLCLFLVRWIYRRKHYDKSLSGVIYSTHNGDGNVPFYHTFGHILTSGMAVGLGGSAGLEAPIALTGSAIGSNLGKLLKLKRDQKVLLLACGGGAGIAAVFASPVAGTMFACEVLLPTFSHSVLVPLLIASATGSVVASAIWTTHSFVQVAPVWSYDQLQYYLLLGVLAGGFAAYLIKCSLVLAKRLEKIPSVWKRAVAGGLVLYVVFLLFPCLKGEGYDHIASLGQGSLTGALAGLPKVSLEHQPWSMVVLLLLLLLLKPVVSVLFLESGGDGGIFGPSLFCGAFLGYLLYAILTLLGLQDLSPQVFICLGMGGVLAGVMHAPLSGIFLTAELTGSFSLLIPLMLVAALSTFVCRSLSGHSLYKSILISRGEQADEQVELRLLSQIKAAALLDRNFIAFQPNDTLRTMQQAVVRSAFSVFPVLTEDGSLAGMVMADELRPLYQKTLFDDNILACDLMHVPNQILQPENTLAEAVNAFDSSAWRVLPVLQDGAFVGFLDKGAVLDYYREMLHDKTEML